MPALNKRLICAANMLQKGRVVADIGTDHAFLPIYLVQNGISPFVIACDIAKKPLEVACQNIAKRGLQNKIQLRLAPGLTAVEPQECSAVTITGMGGETIADIIAAAPWLQSPSYQLVLQPMSCTDRLRRYLDQNGFEILRETAVYSQTRIYTVLHAEFTGKLPEKSAAFAYVGKLPQNGDALSKKLIEKQIATLQKCASALKRVPKKQAQYQQIAKALAELKPLCRQQL